MNITAAAATLTGSIIDNKRENVTQRGFVYADSSVSGELTLESAANNANIFLLLPDNIGGADPSFGGNFVIGGFSRNISSLSSDTAYTYRAFATTHPGTGYGAPRSFTTLMAPPVLAIEPVASVTATSAGFSASQSSNGGAPVTARGFVYSATNPSPRLSDIGADALRRSAVLGSAVSDFTATIADLTPGTSYHVVAYATNSIGTTYSDATSFMTLLVALTVTTQEGDRIGPDAPFRIVAGSTRTLTASNNAGGGGGMKIVAGWYRVIAQ